jgi:hypothetical protein
MSILRAPLIAALTMVSCTAFAQQGPSGSLPPIANTSTAAIPRELERFSTMMLFNCKTSAPLRRKSGENKEKMQGAEKSWTPSEFEQSETRLPPRLMKSHRATMSGLTAGRLAAGSFDARLAADGKSGREQHRAAPPLQSAHRTTDSKTRGAKSGLFIADSHYSLAAD